MAKEKLPEWVRTGKAPAPKPETEKEEPQEEVEITPPPVSEAEKRENEREHRPWTPPTISEAEHKKQIEQAAARPMPVSEGNLPPDRSITPTPPPDPEPMNPQFEQARRLQEVWSQAQAMNPFGMPISGVQTSGAIAEVTREGGVEVRTIRMAMASDR
jgi:hypothetical protein